MCGSHLVVTVVTVVTAVAASSLTLGCGSAAPAVTLAAPWPSSPPSYPSATARWTREVKVYDGIDHVFSVRATAKSAEWRAAYVAERARRQKLGTEAEATLRQEEQAAAEAGWEFQVLLATHDARWNDLAKGDGSIWRVALVGDDGREVLPSEVRADRRPDDEVGAWFPGMKPFFKAYVVNFPKAHADGTPIAGPQSQRLALRLGSGLGSAELEWRAAANAKSE
jgi:hypothetical protein